MMKITDGAADKIKEIMKAEGLPNAGLRIYSASGGCGCGTSQFEIAIDDKAGEGDTVVENAGAKVFVDSDTAASLAGAELGFLSDQRGEGFVLNFPNGAPSGGSCGCGPDNSGGGCGSGSGGSKAGGCGCGC